MGEGVGRKEKEESRSLIFPRASISIGEIGIKHVITQINLTIFVVIAIKELCEVLWDYIT